MIPLWYKTPKICYKNREDSKKYKILHDWCAKNIHILDWSVTFGYNHILFRFKDKRNLTLFLLACSDNINYYTDSDY